MLPILVTIGHGLAWFAVTFGQLIIWGAGISVGFAVGRAAMDAVKTSQWRANYLAKRIAKRMDRSQAVQPEAVKPEPVLSPA